MLDVLPCSTGADARYHIAHSMPHNNVLLLGGQYAAMSLPVAISWRPVSYDAVQRICDSIMGERKRSVDQD